MLCPFSSLLNFLFPQFWGFFDIRCGSQRSTSRVNWWTERLLLLLPAPLTGCVCTWNLNLCCSKLGLLVYFFAICQQIMVAGQSGWQLDISKIATSAKSLRLCVADNSMSFVRDWWERMMLLFVLCCPKPCCEEQFLRDAFLVGTHSKCL